MTFCHVWQSVWNPGIHQSWPIIGANVLASIYVVVSSRGPRHLCVVHFECKLGRRHMPSQHCHRRVRVSFAKELFLCVTVRATVKASGVIMLVIIWIHNPSMHSAISMSEDCIGTWKLDVMVALKSYDICSSCSSSVQIRSI